MNRRSFFKRAVGAGLLLKSDPAKLLKAIDPPPPVMFAPGAFTNGMSMRILRSFDPVQSKFISRMDVLYGFGTGYPSAR